MRRQTSENHFDMIHWFRRPRLHKGSMQAENWMGLMCTGGVNQSFLARMPALLRHLGPIKTSSFRVSRQVANSLRAGYAASHYSVLESCRLILVAAPEARLEHILRDMVARTPIRKAPFSKNMVVLCGCDRDSLIPNPLHATGARVASLNLIPDSREQVFVAEGHPATVRHLCILFAESRRKVITLKPGTKPLFFAGIHAGSPLLLPWVSLGMASLRAAGFSRSEAAMVGEMLAHRALRKHAKAGARAWNRQIEAGLRRTLDHALPAIRSCDARLAELYEQGIRIALGRF
jgi:hypothetical protein